MFLRSCQKSRLGKGLCNSLTFQQRLASSSMKVAAQKFSTSNNSSTQSPLSLLLPLGGLLLWSSWDNNKKKYAAVLLEEGKNTKKHNNNVHVDKELLQQRKIFIVGSIDDRVAKTVVMDLMWLASQDNNEPVTIYIHSSGGMVAAGLAIHDIMRSMPFPVKTVCLGKAYSMAAILLASGTKGHRHCLPNSRVMIHQPSSSLSRSSASDVAIHAASVLSTHKKLVDILSSHTGQSFSIVNEAIDRDNYMSPEDAKKFGVIDEIGFIELNTAGDNDASTVKTNNDDAKKNVEQNKKSSTGASKVDNNIAGETETKNREKKNLK